MKTGELIYKILVAVLPSGYVCLVDNLDNNYEMQTIREILDDDMICSLDDKEFFISEEFNTILKSKIYTCQIKFEFFEDRYFDDPTEYDMRYTLFDFKLIDLNIE